MRKIVYSPTISWSMLFQRPQFVLKEIKDKLGFEPVFYDANPPYYEAKLTLEPWISPEGIKVVPSWHDPKEFEPFTLYFSMSNHYDWIEAHKPENVIYDFLDWPLEGQSKAKLNRAIIDSDIILCVSDKTMNHALGLLKDGDKSKVLYIPNGLDYDFFANKKTIDSPMLQQMNEWKEEGHRILGYAGAIWEPIIDRDLLPKIANSFPDDKFVILGADLAGKPIPDNVHFLGHVPREAFPSALKAFDVGVIPFKQNSFTKSMCPLKYYEYVGAGLKTVSTPIPEVDKIALEGRTLIGDTHEQFLKNIGAALEMELTPNDKKSMDNLAKRFDWSNVLKPFIEKLKEL